MNIHPTSDIQSKKIGSGTVIWQFSVVLSGATLGMNCNINSHCFIENEVQIGNNVTVKCGVYLWDGITIEDDVFIGPNVTFTNDLFPRSKQKFEIYKTTIKRGVSLGANATILAGVTIGEYVMVGAGSVVTKNIPNNTLWVGNPARQTAYICNCGRKLDEALHCSVCNCNYELSNNYIVKK